MVQDWILMGYTEIDWLGVDIHIELTQKKTRPVILAEQTQSIKDLLCVFQDIISCEAERVFQSR